MEWLSDPAVWAGLLTLIVLEIVLGIDNLLFIAILANKLPPHQRDKVRIIGMGLALLMRLLLLSIMAHLVRLTNPVLEFWIFSLSWRDIILLAGGLFLLWKATTELHERLEGVEASGPASKNYASFGLVLLQIVVLDAVFSLDSIITAVGMVQHLEVMMTAVVIAMGVMVMASKSLTRFVNAHPTVVVLCLGFLLMIGLSLVAEGLGYHLPKGYLYAAIGFSIMTEFFNQLRQRNLINNEARLPMRDRTARAVLRLLGDHEGLQQPQPEEEQDVTAVLPPAFGLEERNMVSGVLTLAERTVLSVMTPRSDVQWLDISENAQTLRQQIAEQPHGLFPVCERTGLDNVIGVGRAKDLLSDLVTYGEIRRDISSESTLRPALIVPETLSVIRLTEVLRQSRGHLALVSDEYGTILGLVTPMDVLEAIAGEFPDVGESMSVQPIGPDHWMVDGLTDLHTLEMAVGVHGLASEDTEYSTLTGLILALSKQLPTVGQVVEIQGLRLEVTSMEDRRIANVDIRRLPPDDTASEAA